MRISDIMAISPQEANNMTTDELYIAVLDLSRSVNKMYNNLRSSDFSNVSSVQRLERTGGRLSVMQTDSTGQSTGVEKTRNELLHELRRGQQFYKSGDSSVSKMRANMKATASRLSNLTNSKIRFKSDKEFTDFWHAVNRVMEMSNLVNGAILSSDQVQETVINMGQSERYDKINIETVTKLLNLQYLLLDSGLGINEVEDSFLDTARLVVNPDDDKEWETILNKSGFDPAKRNTERREWRYGGTSGMFSGNN